MGLEARWKISCETMPLLIDLAIYGDCETEAQRWGSMLYNRPVSCGVGYFVNNLKGSKASRVGGEAAGGP